MNQEFELSNENSRNGPKSYVGLGNTGPSMFSNYNPSPNFISAATSINEDKKENNVEPTTKPEIIKLNQKLSNKKSSQKTKKERVNKLFNPNENEPVEFDYINLNSSDDMNQKNFLGKKKEHEKSLKVGKKRKIFFVKLIEYNKTKGINLKEELENIYKEHTAPNTLEFEGEKINKDNLMKASFKQPYKPFVKVVEILGDITLERHNLNNVFGGVARNKKLIKLKFYQLICLADDKGKNKEKLENAVPKDENLYIYFLTRTYEFLLEKYSKEIEPMFNIGGESKSIPGFKCIDEVLEHIYGHYPNDKKEKKISDIKKMTSNILNNFKGLKESKHSNPKGLGLDIEEVKIKKFEEYQEKDNHLIFNFNNQELKEKQIENDNSSDGNNKELNDISERVEWCSFDFKKDEGSKIFDLNGESNYNLHNEIDHRIFGNILSEKDGNMFGNNTFFIQSSENGLNLLFSDLRDYEKNLFV